MIENTSTVLFLINDDIRAIRVAYEDGGKNRETVKKTFLRDLAIGDYVLVETETRWGATVCRVVALDVEVDFTSTERIGWIFAKAPLDDLEKLKEQETSALQIINEARKREAKEKLRETIMAQCGSQLKALPAFSVRESTDTASE